jgi:uncharacterized membrane protein (DUF485 family)
MSHSIHHRVEDRERSYSVIKLNARSIAFATGIATAFVYMLCVLFIAFMPRTAMIFFGYILHADLTNIVRSVGWGSFITGLFDWSLGTGLYAAFIARLYNRLVSKSLV